MNRRPENYIGYFDEAPNHRSSTRLMAMMMLVASMGFGGWAMLIPETRATGMQLVVVFLTGNVSSKSLGKFAETGNNHHEEQK
jgi:hypothetical protein